MEIGVGNGYVNKNIVPIWEKEVRWVSYLTFKECFENFDVWLFVTNQQVGNLNI